MNRKPQEARLQSSGCNGVNLFEILREMVLNVVVDATISHLPILNRLTHPCLRTQLKPLIELVIIENGRLWDPIFVDNTSVHA